MSLGIRARYDNKTIILAQINESQSITYSGPLIGVRLGQEPPLPAFLRLIRFTKITVLIADIWTILYAVSIFGWQMASLLREGNWAAMPLSYVLGYNRGAPVDAVLRVPAIVPLLFAAALLTAFYLWLTHIEKRYSGN
jgi:hypothetical protein